MSEAIRQGDIPGVQLRCRQVLALPLPAAWTWLADAGKLRRWLAEEAAVEPGPGGSLTLEGIGESGESRRERGKTVTWSPPGQWVLAFEQLGAGWNASTRLAWTLHPRESGVELDVLQDGFHRLPLSLGLTVWEAYRRRWRSALARLAVEVAAG